MWLALWAVLLVVVFGSKVLSLGLQLVLLAIHKVGLLSRIRVDERTTLQLTLKAVRVCLWRNVWKFLWLPSQEPLITIEIPAVHLVVRVKRGPRTTKTTDKPANNVEFWTKLDTSQSFKRLDHPMWRPFRKWTHRLPFVWVLLPLVAFTVSRISVDVVEEDTSGHTSVVRVQKASLAFHYRYHVTEGEIELLLAICPDEVAVVTMHALGVDVQLRDLQLKIRVPISRTHTDLRVPVPSSISVACAKIGGSVNLAKLLQEVTRSTDSAATNATAYHEASRSSGQDLFKEILAVQRVLPIRLLQIVPEVHVALRDISVAIDNGASNRFDISLEILEGRIKHPASHLRPASLQAHGEDIRHLDEERELSLDLVNLSAINGSASSVSRSSQLRIDTLKAEIDTRLAMCSSTADQLSWSTRVSGELRGVAVRLADDLAPLVENVVTLGGTPIPNQAVEGDQPLHLDIVREEREVSDDGNDRWCEMLAVEMQVQLKVFRTEILCAARSKKCAVLPSGVPDIGLSIDEVVIFANPFIDREPLGIRAKADLQAMRLKLFYAQSDRLLRPSFLSMDFVRVFIEPVCLLGTEVVPAEVEMEAEWLEVRWTPEAMHSIGGMLDLGIVVLAPLMRESYDWTSDDFWDPQAVRNVKPMKKMIEITEDHVSDAEAVKFRCKVKRALVIFSHTHNGRNHVDFVTVDTLYMSVEETTGRFRLSISDINISHTDGAQDLRPSPGSGLTQQRHRAMRRRPSSLPVSGASVKSEARRQEQNLPSPDQGADGGRPFFSVKVFALEETKLPSCPFTVLDMFVDDVSCAWRMETQERIVELIRCITFSTWEMLYRMRSAYGVHCTSSTSRYNRKGGRNPPMDDTAEFANGERLMKKLISAGGDALNRIYATNIDLRAEFRDGRRSYDVKLHVGVFGSDDLPELWQFEDVYVTIGESLKLVAVDRVLVRHTVGRRRDYVFGFFEEALRLRQIACSRLASDSPRNDGMLIDIDGLRVCLSLQLDLVEFADTIQAHVAPYLDSHMTSFSSCWRPQDEIFYSYFLRIPNTQGQPKVWLQLYKMEFECVDKPLEAWLEHMYPLWMEELAEQELRSQLLEEQVTALKLTNADMLISDTAADEMKGLLHEKSSRVYAHKIKRLQANASGAGGCNSLQSGSIVTVHVGFVAVDVSFEACERTVTSMIRGLDEATPVFDRVLHSSGIDPISHQPKYSLLLHQNLNVSVVDISIRMRKFLTPVAIIEQVKVAGDVIIAAHDTPTDIIDAFAFTGALRCFLDLSVAIDRPVAFFGPAYIYTMQELGSIAERITPNLVLDVDSVHKTAPWDIARRLVHGKLRLQVKDVALRLLASANSFEGGDYLEVGVQQVDITCGRGDGISTEVNIDRLTVKIEPDALVNIAEISTLALQVTVGWTSRNDASMHYIYPAQFQPRDCGSRPENSPGTIVDFTAGSVWRGRSGKVDVATCLQRYSGAHLTIAISGKIAPRTTSETMSRRDIASRSAIVLYTKHVEWLIRFARIYQTLPLHQFPSRRRHRTRHVGKQLQPGAPPVVDRFLSVFKSAVVEEFSVVGLDVASYHSEKSPVGIRACINDKIALSGLIASADKSSRRSIPTKPSRSLPVELNGFHFIVDDVSLAVSDIQVRICTPKTGSRGESLVSIRNVCLYVGGSSKSTPVAHSMQFDFATIHSEFDHASASSSDTSGSRQSSIGRSSTSSLTSIPVIGQSDVSRTKSKKTILEHFAIQQHNPYCFRDDDGEATTASSTGYDAKPFDSSPNGAVQLDFVEEFRRQGFILGLVASEIRVLVSLDAIEALVDIVENWVRVIRSSLPEIHRVPEELLHQQNSSDPSANQASTLDSPKKASSLADDPKFGAIFHASNPLPKNRTPTFSADTSSESDSTPSTILSSTGASIVEPFLTVRFMDCQINIQDHQNKGSVLLALSCGSLRHSRSQDINHELIDLKVDGVQLFTAPLDIDVRSRVIWLLTLSDGITYCPSSYGLLKQVVAPIPTQVMIWVDRDISVMNRVDLRIPTVEIGVNIDSKNILQNLVLAVMTVVTTKLAEYTAPDYSKMLQGFRVGTDPKSVRTSLQQLVQAKKQLQWKIAELLWQNTCRWNYQGTERTSMAMHAVEGVRAHGFVDMEATNSPFLHPRRMSSTSFISSMGTSLSLTGSAATHVEAASDELQRLQQQCDSISDILRSLVAAELLKRQPNPNVQLAFTLQKASLTLSAANSDIVSASMANLKVNLKMYEDQAGTFALTIQDLSCKNLSPNTPYPELLQALQGSKSWSGDEMFLRVDADVAPPVAGIQVVRHFEVNVHPMQVCLSYDLILQLVSFFTTDSAPTQRQEEKKAEIRSQFLAAPQQSGSSSSDGLLKKAAKVAGKAAHPLTHGLGRHRAEGDSERAFDPRAKAMQALQEEASQWITRLAHAATDKSVPPDEEAGSTGDKDINEMRDRAKNNIMFKRVRLGTVEVMVSFKNKKNNSSANATTPLPLEDMRGFEVKIHSLVYCDKTCSLADLLLRIRRDIILDVLSQVGRNFTNVANFLRDQFDITRWGAFDALAPLKSLSTAITGSGHTAVVPMTTSASNPPSSPTRLSIDVLQQSPRVSRDGAVTPTTPVDSSKVFQLELPDKHPSRKKKTPSHSRPSEPTARLEPATSNDTPSSPMGSPKPDKKEDTDTSHKPKRMLSSFFGGKSKKAIQSPTTTVATRQSSAGDTEESS